MKHGSDRVRAILCWTRLRPTVVFPATERYCSLASNKLYCLVTKEYMCVNNLPRVVTSKCNGHYLNPHPLDCSNYYGTTWIYQKSIYGFGVSCSQFSGHFLNKDRFYSIKGGGSRITLNTHIHTCPFNSHHSRWTWLTRFPLDSSSPCILFNIIPPCCSQTQEKEVTVEKNEEW